MENKNIKFVFFGSSEISVITLNELKKNSLLPSLIVTQPDKPKGRGLDISESLVKIWAKEKNIRVKSPKNLKDESFVNLLKEEVINGAKVFILVSFGRIIPNEILNLAPQGILNLHPSLLPKLRGPSPIETSILNDEKDEVGLSIIVLDKEMDHGPIVKQEKIEMEKWPVSKSELTKIFGEIGGKLLAEEILKAEKETLALREQDHSEATFTKKFTKEDSLIDLSEDPYKNYLKFLAFEKNPATYFFIEHQGKKIRVKISKAKFSEGKFCLERVTPEGKKEMDLESFKRGYKYYEPV
ncbi:MAG: methionyl-tRNA formyltransferase [Candidatus Paceibacterota bacterium]